MNIHVNKTFIEIAMSNEWKIFQGHMQKSTNILLVPGQRYLDIIQDIIQNLKLEIMVSFFSSVLRLLLKILQTLIPCIINLQEPRG